MADINIFGTLRSGTTSKVIAVAAEIKDENLGKTQAEINSELTNRHVILSESAYEALEEKNADTIYMTYEDDDETTTAESTTT